MRLRVYGGKASWWEPFSSSVASVEPTDSLANQLEHFAAVIRDGVPSACSGRDGLKSLRLVDAVLESARTGLPVDLDEFHAMWDCGLPGRDGVIR